MKKPLLFFIAVFMAVQGTAGAITIKTKPTVKKQETSVKDMGASLLPTVVNLVSGIKEITKKQKELTSECMPTSQEIVWVNNIVKEWAKTGAATADEVQAKLSLSGWIRCSSPEGGYETSVRIAGGTGDEIGQCYDWFGGPSNKDAVWYQFPMAKLTYYCIDGELDSCTEKNRKYVSNIYDVFNLVDFSQADYSKDDFSKAQKIMDKIEKCSYAKLDERKKAMWGEFLVNTIGNVGQKTNTGTIMQSVSGIASGGDLGSGLGALGGVAAQFMNR
ncbi:MAG: hypothetical protein R8M37_00770 [Alphaproteobacteria bacterium]|nr:hypothetical protein [Alphaproteobacteria bacterium]